MPTGYTEEYSAVEKKKSAMSDAAKSYGDADKSVRSQYGSGGGDYGHDALGQAAKKALGNTSNAIAGAQGKTQDAHGKLAATQQSYNSAEAQNTAQFENV